jgi:acetylornithine deacetylase/succinyl-diaminopimelate desuccinylase-like protein
MARATINCRILPGVPAAEVERTLVRVLNDDQIKLSRVTQPQPSPASPLTPEVMGAIERTTKKMWNIPVVPVMETGATDGRLTRNAGIPTYGASGVFVDVDDVRAHGKDERIGVQDFYDGVEHIFQLAKAVSSPTP